MTQVAEGTKSKAYSLADFTRDVEAVIQKAAEDSGGGPFQRSTDAQKHIVAGTEPLLARFLSEGTIPAEYCGPQDGVEVEDPGSHYSYRVNMLYRGKDDRFCIISTMWPPDASTGVHDHNGTFVVEGVYQGKMRTTKYERLDDGQRDGFAELKDVWTGTAEVGETTHVLWPEEDIHEYTNAISSPSVTIHIYGADPSKE
ncbi:MAG: 3-mercaptopropionate dioxygenase, partial [Frankiales bacterium]|nr:3-mercaptopropionate dioxygenase [Frankiales bacterium]